MVTPNLPVHGRGEPRPPVDTLSAMLDYAAATATDVVALRHMEASLTYGGLQRASGALARRIARHAGPGEKVALLLPNSIEFQVSYHAAMKALTAPILLNPLYPAPQISPILRQVSPRALICTVPTRALAQELASLLGGTAVICLGDDLAVATLAAEAEGRDDRRRPDPGDIAALLLSGGTTGVPKAVVYTHSQLVTAVRCAEYSWPTRASGEVWLAIAPFTHIFGFLTGALAPVAARAEVVVPERFKPELIVDLMSRHRVTVFGGGPPTIYAGLLAASNLASADLSALAVCAAGGAPMPLELLERWRRLIGVEIHEGYGMTEMAPISGTTELSGVRPGSVGKPIPCNEVEIVDVETGTRLLPPGEQGEVRIRGPHMMSGYLGRPEETAEVLRDGFIYTGDIGYLDADGFLFITDRKKDVVIVKGFNVFPREVEEVLYTHPQVAGAGVVGVPDARSGECIVAYVVARDGALLSESEISAFLASRLVAYKCPAVIRVVDHLPTTGVGKLDRPELRRQVLDQSKG